MPLIPFGLQTTAGDSAEVATERLINFYPEATDARAKSPVVLYGRPGLVTWATAGSGPIRAAVKMGGNLYVVSGTEVYQVTTAGTATLLSGPAVPGTGPLSMAAGVSQAMIAGGATGSYVVTASSVAQITDPDFLNAKGVIFQDTYMITAVDDSTGDFQVSSGGNATLWDASDAAAAEARPDTLVTVFENQSELYLMGAETIEVWDNAGSGSPPYQRISTAPIIERGLIAAFSPARIDNSLVWLGDDLVVYRLDGYSPRRISTHYIEERIAEMSDPSAAEAWIFEPEGHKFYVLNFPGEATFVYDAAGVSLAQSLGVSGIWWEAKLQGRDDFPLRNGVSFAGKHLACSTLDGTIYELSDTAYTDDGAEIECTARTPVIHNFPGRLTMNRLEIDFEGGVGLLSGQGVNPMAMLRWSDDAGRTWSQEEWRPIGPQGHYKQRSTWHRLGTFGARTFELSITDPIKRVILGADGDTERLEP